jgi:MFS superfamily sulfate permease-like transporter
MVEQLPELLGLTMEKHVGDISTFEKAKSVFHAFDTAHGATVGVGIGSFLFLVACKFAKKSLKKKYPWVTMIPEILLLVMINLILSYTLDFKSLGIRVLGEFDNKLPTPSFPILSLELINSLMSDVVTITIVGFIECQTVTRNYGLKHGYYPSGNQELFALGISNVIGSCLGAYVTFGSLPRSRIQATVGGKSNLTGVFAALFVFISFTFFASVLKFLPRAALAGVVFNAAVNLIEYHEILFMFKMRIVSDILLFFVAWFITLFLTMGDGILLCLLLAVLIILRRTTAVNLRLLGYLPNSNTVHNYVDMKEFPEAEVVDGVLIMGLKGSLCFYNAGQLRRTMEHLMKTEKRLFLEAKDMVRQPTNSSTRTLFDRSKDLFKFKKDESKQDEVLSGGSSIDADPIEMVFGLSEFDDQYDTDDRFCVILDFCNCSDVDSASVFILKRIVTNFKKEDTRILFTGVNDNFRELMRTSGLDHALGKNNLFQNIPQAIANIQNRKFSENLSPSRHSTISIL